MRMFFVCKSLSGAPELSFNKTFSVELKLTKSSYISSYWQDGDFFSLLIPELKESGKSLRRERKIPSEDPQWQQDTVV